MVCVTHSSVSRVLGSRVQITVDLAAQTVTGPDGKSYGFDMDPFAKYRMLNGLDDIDVTMEYEKEFDAFEQRYKKDATWLFAE